MRFAYVEYLRALRALRIVAILLALLILAALIARLSWGKLSTTDDYLSAAEHSPTAHITRTTLPNGRTRTVIDDPKKNVHTVVERQGDAVTRVSSMSGGSARVEASPRETPRSVPTNAPARSGAVGVSYAYAFFDIGSLFSMTIPLGLLAATLLAGPLSKENNGHLELAWTKPVSRERYALAAVAVDVTVVAVAQVATSVALLLASLFWEVPKLSFALSAVPHVAFALLAPAAWYACLTAFSASLKRGPGAVLGIGWVIAVVCPAVAATTRDSATAVGRSVYAIFNTVSVLDPITYAWFRTEAVIADSDRATVTGLLALAVLAILYLALAVAQWRRVEA
jgi:hypothetical protein